MSKKEPTIYEQMLAVEQFKRSLPSLLEIQPLIAKARKKSFDDHVAAGFTEEQAVILCQKVTL